ncbi:MAG: tRNA (adenosine(37)-N6)-dimethylallyltransferase MiaA [Victivallaceae bacterium]|nr:tRNA (adenosine(37)-N6)-dimethylallyltransferase MiaA [Victivallaceae bacterium]
MLPDKPEIVAIMGPTASGKSALALEFARQNHGEIVSVDSMQLYRGLEIGTAQPTAAERKAVPHHLVGVLDLAERADVFDFVRRADAAIADIARRGKLPVLAGGTGMYMRALLCGMDDLPGDRELRQRLDDEYDSDAGEAALHEKMAQLDPAALNRWQNCRRRLIRALEVRLITGKSIMELQTNTPKRRYPVRAFRLDPSPDALKQKIARRARLMLDNGWLEEAETALRSGLLDSQTAHQAIGYREIGEFLNGKLDRETLENRIAVATWQYARRQRTWFRHQEPQTRRLDAEDMQINLNLLIGD